MIDLTSELRNKIREFKATYGREVSKEHDVIATSLDPMDWSITTFPGDDIWAFQSIKMARDASIPLGEIRILAGMAPTVVLPEVAPQFVSLPPKRRIKTR